MIYMAKDEKLGGGGNSTLANYPQMPEQQEWLSHESASASLCHDNRIGRKILLHFTTRYHFQSASE